MINCFIEFLGHDFTLTVYRYRISLHRFGEDYTIHCDLVSNRSLSNTLNQAVCVTLSRHVMYGVVTKVISLPDQGNHQLIINSPLYLLQQSCNIIMQQSLKNALQLLLKPLADYFEPINISLDCSALWIDYFDSQASTTLQCFNTLCRFYGLQYYFEFAVGSIRFIVCEAIPNGSIQKMTLVNARGHYCEQRVVYDLCEHYQHLPAKISLYDEQGARRPMVLRATYCSRHPVATNGIYYCNHITCKDQHALDQLAQHMCQALDSQRYQISVKTPAIDIKLGDQLRIAELSTQDFRVIAIGTQFKQATHAAHQLDDTAVDQITYLRLLPSEYAYRHWPLSNYAHTSSFSMAQVNHGPVSISDAYCVKYADIDDISPPLRQITPIAGQNHGMHFPLQTNDPVLLLKGQFATQKPMILGSYYQDDKPAATTQSDCYTVIQSKKGQRLQFDDKTQAITLSSLNDRAQLKLCEQGIFLSTKQGGMQFNSHGLMHMHCQQHYQVYATQSITMAAKQQLNLSSQAAGIQLDAMGKCVLSSQGHIYSEAAQQCLIRSQTDIRLIADTDLVCTAANGDWVMQANQGDIQMMAKQTITFESLSADIVLKTAHASLTLTHQGNVIIEGEGIYLDAKQITMKGKVIQH